MIEAMSFVEIVGPRDVFDTVLDVLQQMGVMHVEETAAPLIPRLMSRLFFRPCSG